MLCLLFKANYCSGLFSNKLNQCQFTISVIFYLLRAYLYVTYAIANYKVFSWNFFAHCRKKYGKT